MVNLYKTVRRTRDAKYRQLLKMGDDLDSFYIAACATGAECITGHLIPPISTLCKCPKFPHNEEYDFYAEITNEVDSPCFSGIKSWLEKS